MNKEYKKVKYIVVLSLLIVGYILLSYFIFKSNFTGLWKYVIIGAMTLILSIITAYIFKNYLFKGENFKGVIEVISWVDDFSNLIAITYLLLDMTPINMEKNKHYVLIFFCFKLFAFIFSILDSELVQNYEKRKDSKLSKDLSYNDYMESLKALNEFRNDNPDGDIKRNIIIHYKDNKIELYENVTLEVAERLQRLQLDIYWEDAMPDFKKLGLKGIYDPKKTVLSYDGNDLVISDQGNKIIIK